MSHYRALLWERSLPPSDPDQHALAGQLAALCTRCHITPPPQLRVSRLLAEPTALAVPKQNGILISETFLGTLTDLAEREAILAHEIAHILLDNAEHEAEIATDRLAASLLGDTRPLRSALQHLRDIVAPSAERKNLKYLDQRIHILQGPPPPPNAKTDTFVALHRIRAELSSGKIR